MTTARLPLHLKANATFKLLVTWNDSNGDPVDLTGGKAYFALKSGWGEEALFEYDESAGVTLGGALGTALATVPNTDTIELAPGSVVTKGVYIFEAETSSGERKRLVEGPWDCAPR